MKESICIGFKEIESRDNDVNGKCTSRGARDTRKEGMGKRFHFMLLGLGNMQRVPREKAGTKREGYILGR